MADSEQVKRARRKFAALENERKKWEPHWQLLAKYFSPRRIRINGDRMTEGQMYNLAHSVPANAAKTLASGMHSGLTNQAQPWFELSLQEEELAQTEDAKLWLHDTTTKCRNIIGGSNFYESVYNVYFDVAVFGTACLFIEEDAESIVRFRSLVVGEYSIATNEKGRVDTLYRRIKMTAQQIVDSWTDSCPQTVKDKAGNSSTEEIAIIHAVEPNREKKNGSKRKDERPFTSLYFVEAGGDVLEHGGYYEFPALCPRWSTVCNDVYGISPAMDALADVRALQEMRQDGRKALRLSVSPPLLASGIGDTEVSMSANAITHIPSLSAGNVGVRPLLEVRPDLANLYVAEQGDRELIREIMFNQLFAMFDNVNKQMTATEIAARNSEKMLQLAPILSRLRSEFFQPLIERVFNIMTRNGITAAPPESLNGQVMKIKFVSILERAMEQVGMSGINTLVGFIGQVAQMKPEVLDKFNFDAAVDTMADMAGVPPNLTYSTDDVQEMRQQRQEQMQQMQQMQMLQQGAGIAGSVAGAAKDVGLTAENMGAASGQQ